MAHAVITFRSWLSSCLPARSDDRGASLVEYALLLALIAVICVAAVSALGGTVSTNFSSTADGFSAN